MKAFLFLAFAVLTLSSGKAEASGLFYDNGCVAVGDGNSPMFFAASADFDGAFGLSCQDIKDVQRAVSYSQVVLMPAMLALNQSGASARIAAQLAALGLTYANPAVLSVAVVGAFGVSVMYLVLQTTIEDCEKMEKETLKKEIMRELESKYGLKSVGSPSMVISR